MIKQGKLQSQKTIMFSKDISSLPTSIEAKNQSPIIQEDSIHPRVFPDSKIPLKVAIMRKIKSFEQFQLNNALKNIDWKYGKGLLQLMHYNFISNFAAEECTSQRLQKKLIVGRAFDGSTKTIKDFLVKSVKSNEQECILSGYFKDNPKDIVQINKFYVCLSFENPQHFYRIVMKAQENRDKFISTARFNFYIDNMDLQDAPEIPKLVLNNITKMIGVQFLNRQYYRQVNNHFKRTMNQILFSHTVLNDHSLVLEKISLREKRKINEHKPKNKVITLYKDGKKFKLTLKSLKTKIEQIESKTIFFKEDILFLMHRIKSKLQMIYNYQIFDLKQQLFVIERFISDNMLMVGYFLHFIDENVIGYIADLVRNSLIENADGWFKIYETDKNTYLLSKLRRLFIFIEQNIKTIIKNHVQAEVLRYCQCFKRRLPISINLESFSKYEIIFDHTKENPIHYPPLIAISCNIGFNTFQMTIKKQKIEQLLKKNLINIFNRLEFINTPQNKALIEIYAIFKDQYGIDIQLPKSSRGQQSIFAENIKINHFQLDWISKEFSELNIIISKSIITLSIIQNKLHEISNEINLKQIINDNNFNIPVKAIVAKIHQFMNLNDKLQVYFEGQGINFGLFFIDYKPAKDQLRQLIQKKIGMYKSLLIAQYQVASTSIQRDLMTLIDQISKKPSNIYQLVNQRDTLNSLESIIGGYTERRQLYLYNLCEEFKCIMPRSDLERRWLNMQKVKDIFNIKTSKIKQYNDIKKDIIQKIKKQKDDIMQILKLFQVTLENIKYSTDRQDYQQNYAKMEHLNSKYNTIKGQIKDIRYKQQHLSLEAQNFEDFQKIEQDFLILYAIWQVTFKWQTSKKIWYFNEFSQFQISKPEILLTEMLASIKKIEKIVKSNYSIQLSNLIMEIKKQIQIFQDKHLRLLKLLKKDGFNKKHLQKIGIYIDFEIHNLTLQKALDLNFLQMVQQIEAVSNDAWNQFYLDQTLNRVQDQLLSMKFELIVYLDKKGNEIPLVNNYAPLNEKLQQVILDLQSVQFNPMKGNFEKKIQDLLDKSIYISKSLENCEIFQKKFVEVHPIFDSTDVVKQLPVENRLFTKILRNWVQLLKYFKKIISVYDACNGQNIAQKMAFLINSIQNVKVGLRNYLHKKRQGFSRFYLLTDQQLYQLFASTNDMKILSKHISKLFHSINDLSFDDEAINSIIGINTNFSLKTKVIYKKQNLEQWLSRLQRSIKETLNHHFESLMKNDHKWSSMLNFQSSQILLMCYEIEKSLQLSTMTDYQTLQKKERNFIKSLVDIKKRQSLTIEQSVNLSSLLVLALYFSEKLNFFKANNITDPQNFEIKKMMKIYYKDQEIKIASFQTQIPYGFQYLGLVRRLVLTNLTERMQLIYMSAIKYSLGGSAIGPAGTGKSQTTKDIARICGKNCIIYNCSQSLNIDILVRILKGMAVTGLWVCLDQFNRLHYQVLNMMSEQLSIIFKYKVLGVKLDVQYDREVINFKPDFHLCITYNPTYLGRQNIPNSIQKQFRIVAMVNCDKKMICKLLFYTKGFKQADILSEKLTELFEFCQNLWYNFSLYDFGLRSLISIIELTGLLYKGEGNGEIEVFQAIKTIVFPRLSTNHRQILEVHSKKVFKDIFFEANQNNVAAYTQQINNILNVRLGIILLGDIFSNKSTIMKTFEESYKDYRIEQIYINTLTIEEIYGETNTTTRIFKDGYLTKKLREYITTNPKEKLIIYIKGVIFPDWIENLNSVLDNTRSLSLPSGEILWIPDKIKFVINCNHLDFASPATISRSCVVSYKAKTFKELIRCNQDQQKLKVRSIEIYEVLIKQIKDHLIYEVDQRLLIHWINKYIAKSKALFTVQAFMHALSLIFEGMLNEEGKNIFNHSMRSYFEYQDTIFDNYWDGRYWKKINDFPMNLFQPSAQQVYIGNFIVKNAKYKKIHYINKTFFTNKGGLEDMLLLIGNQNIGKSSITSDIYQKLDKKLIQYNRINLTKTTKNVDFYNAISAMLSKKSNKRKGLLHGKELILLLDDLHLPQKNKYQYKNTIEFLTLLLSKKGCYNYNSLEFQNMEDLYLIGNNNLKKRQLNFSKEFLKYTLPVFVQGYNQQHITQIFTEIIHFLITNEEQVKIYSESSQRLGKLISPILQLSTKYLPKYLRFEFIHFRRVISNILQWNLKDHSNKKQIIPQIFQYQTQRILLSRIQNPETLLKFKDAIRKQLSGNLQCETYFHSFEKTENGTSINVYKCNRVSDHAEFTREIQYLCDEYMLHSDNPNYSYVVFHQLCVLVCRISRAFSLKRGHVSIVGLPKCGKKVIVQLCNYLIHGKIYQMSDRYQHKAWTELIKNATKQSIVNKNSSVLLIQHHQLKETIQKQQLNTLIKSSFLPHVYSEADYQELTYLFQNQLIKTHQAVNKENTIKLFINFLNDNLHIVMLFNPIMNDFKENLISYPAILKETEFYWIVQWPTEALQMIATQAIVETQLEPYISVFPKIHKICKEETQKKTNILHWQGLYLDFLKCFEKIYEQRQMYLKNKLELLKKGFNIIKETQLKLQATRDQIKKLQPAILILEKQTIKTIKSLNIQKANAESVNEQLVKKESQCEKVIGEANAVKIKLEITNNRVQEDLKKAWQNVYLVKQNHIAQIKSLMNPSELIKIVITAIVIILNEGQFEIIRNKSQDGITYEQSYFETGKRYILSKDSKHITKMLTEYNKQRLTKQKIATIQEKCLNHPRWNIIQAKSANKAVFYFFLWVEAVVKYFKLFQQTIPMREQLFKTTQIYQQKSKQIDIVKKELDIYEKKIKQLTVTHKEKTDKLTQYTNQIKLYQKMLSRGYEILKQIQTEKSKWVQYQQQISEKFLQNAGNSIVSSALITYLSPHTKQMRNHILGLIKSQLDEAKVFFNRENIFWLMQSEQRIILKEMGIYDDKYILNNLKIIEKTDKISFIIDPEQEGIKYIKNMYKTQGIMHVQKIDYYHNFFKKTLQKALAEGSIIFVQLNGLELPFLIQALINPVIRKNESNGITEIVFNQKSLYFNTNFKLYLFNTGIREDAEYSIQLISKVTTINFSITPKQLQEHLISTIIALQFPQENQELNEINKINIKDNIELKTIENKILAIFATMTNCEEILKTQDLLQILSTSNRLYIQIQQRIQESNSKKKVLKSRREHYRKKGQKMSRLYFQIKKLSHISSYYQYSFSWFIGLLKQNLNNFTQTLIVELSKGLAGDKKIIAPLLIAQSQFPNLQFSKFFNDKSEDNHFVQEKYRLNVSKLRLARIISNIKSSEIENLEIQVLEHPQKFNNVFNSNVQDILESIPDQFSALQFFNKIALINCFRPDCTLKLLKEWFDINLGTSSKSDQSKLLQYTANNKPILVFQSSNSIQSSVEMVYKLFDTYFLGTGKSICYINSNHCSLDRVKILVESGFSNDQWIVLEGLGQQYAQINEIIINLMEEGDFKRKDVFRFWIIINEYELKNIRDKLIKMSNKIIFQDEVNIIKKISSFFMTESSRLESLSNNNDLNKKKYMLHELIIFHYMLTEKSRYRQKQWNQSIHFSQDDLQLNVKYLYFTSSQELRKLYPNIITNIIYGGKITDQKDIDTISLHIEETIKNMIMDRGIFWQTVWADDKFPKSELQYETYLKSTFNKNIQSFKSIYQQYGITSFVTNFTKQKQYRQIMEFYNRSKLQSNKGNILPIVKAKLQQIHKIITKKMAIIAVNFEAHKKNVLYNFLVDEQEYYNKKMDFIQRDITYYLQLDGLFTKDQVNWCMDIMNNKTPKTWQISTIHSLESWIALFLDGYQATFKINYQDWNHQEQIKYSSSKRIYSLQFCHHLSTFCFQIFSINKVNTDTHSLFWETQKIDQISSNIGVKVDKWYLWNAIFETEVKPLRQGTIQLNYYSVLPLGILTVIDNLEVKKLNNYSKIQVYHSSFEYGDNPTSILNVYMPVEKNEDQQWLKRMRVHLTLAL